MGVVGPLILILILRIGCPELAKCWWGPQGFRGVALARWKVIWSSVKVGAVGPLIRLSPPPTSAGSSTIAKANQPGFKQFAKVLVL